MNASSRSGLDAGQMVGIRLARNAPVVFVSIGVLEAGPRARVMVRLDGEDREREAIVVVGTGYLVSTRGVPSAGAVLRLA